MKLFLTDIKEGGLTLNQSEPVALFAELGRAEKEEDIRFLAPVTMALRLVRLDDLVEVSGTVSTQVEMACARCLKRVSQPLATDVELTFRQLAADSEAPAADEVELQEEELGLVPFTGDVLDLAAVVQEQVLLALPLQPLCGEGCRGLCPECGCNRNDTTCACGDHEFPGPFSALKGFKGR